MRTFKFSIVIVGLLMGFHLQRMSAQTSDGFYSNLETEMFVSRLQLERQLYKLQGDRSLFSGLTGAEVADELPDYMKTKHSKFNGQTSNLQSVIRMIKDPFIRTALVLGTFTKDLDTRNLSVIGGLYSTEVFDISKDSEKERARSIILNTILPNILIWMNVIDENQSFLGFSVTYGTIDGSKKEDGGYAAEELAFMAHRSRVKDLQNGEADLDTFLSFGIVFMVPRDSLAMKMIKF